MIASDCSACRGHRRSFRISPDTSSGSALIDDPQFIIQRTADAYNIFTFDYRFAGSFGVHSGAVAPFVDPIDLIALVAAPEVGAVRDIAAQSFGRRAASGLVEAAVRDVGTAVPTAMADSAIARLPVVYFDYARTPHVSGQRTQLDSDEASRRAVSATEPSDAAAALQSRWPSASAAAQEHP